MDAVAFSRWVVAIGYTTVLILTLTAARHVRTQRPSRFPLYVFGAAAVTYWAVFYGWLAIFNPPPTTVGIVFFHVGHWFIIAHVLVVFSLHRHQQREREQWLNRGSPQSPPLSLLSEEAMSQLERHDVKLPKIEFR